MWSISQLQRHWELTIIGKGDFDRDIFSLDSIAESDGSQKILCLPREFLKQPFIRNVQMSSTPTL